MPEQIETPKKTKASQREHYVSNKDFSLAVVDYVKIVKEARLSGKEEPRITEYIGDAILKISEGLSRKPNFVRYSYREEMVMDGVENCLRALMNYNIDAATRSGLPNAFGYFTQICFFAFLRRIAREKRQQDIKVAYIDHAGINAFADFGDDDGHGDGMIEKMRSRLDHFHGPDDDDKVAVTVKPPKAKRQIKISDNNVEAFTEE